MKSYAIALILLTLDEKPTENDGKIC